MKLTENFYYLDIEDKFETNIRNTTKIIVLFKCEILVEGDTNKISIKDIRDLSNSTP